MYIQESHTNGQFTKKRHGLESTSGYGALENFLYAYILIHMRSIALE